MIFQSKPFIQPHLKKLDKILAKVSSVLYDYSVGIVKDAVLVFSGIDVYANNL
jgi:hypothetical protein